MKHIFWNEQGFLEWNRIIGNDMELFGIKMNEKECSRIVPIRNARKDYIPL